jgi:hypothetical protein
MLRGRRKGKVKLLKGNEKEMWYGLLFVGISTGAQSDTIAA